MKNITIIMFVLWGAGLLIGCSEDAGKNAALAGDGGWEMDNSDYASEPSSVAPGEGDKYEDVGTNPFVMTGHDPFSTFAADVDTASYDIFYRDITDGYLPQKESVRLEEYVNYFDYDYEAPAETDEHPFHISLAGGVSIGNPDTSLLRVAIQGKLPDLTERPRANLVFLIDTSGSMVSSDKLGLVKYILTKTLNVLEQGDTVSLVTYAGSTGVVLEPTDIAEKELISDKIMSLESGGSTAGSAGIDLAYQQAEAGFYEGAINHVILCTDGDFNVGTSTDAALVAQIEEKRESGITLTVLGFGAGNLNDSMMEKISNAGNGTYAVISSQSQAKDYVEKRMLSSMKFIAKDMKIQVEFNPDYIEAYRLLGYENRAIADEDFTDDTVDAGEIGEGHRVTALYELVRANGQIPAFDSAPEIDDGEPVEGEREIGENQMILVKVRYKDVDAAAQDEGYETRASADVDILEKDTSQMDPDLQWAGAIAAFAEILKQSPYANEDAMASIESIVLAEDWLAADRAEFAELFIEAKSMF